MKYKSLLSFLLLFLLHASMASAQIVLLAGDYPDPTVLKDGDDYYMTHSPLYYQPGFLIWHSRDLLNWQPLCRAGSEWAGSAWAPDLQKVGDTYYIYFPAAGTIWVISSKDIRGPWSKPIDLKIGGIDPGLAVTPEGKRYLFTNTGNVTPLTDDGLARAGATKRVYGGWQYPTEWETECMCLESPKINYRNGYYYMTSAEGGTAGPATSHMAVCARAKDVYGPWEDSPYNPIVHTYSAAEQWWSKGHGTVVEGPDGQWWIVYHAYNKKAYALGRHTLMEPIEWTVQGWYRPVKDLPLPAAGRMPAMSDDFNVSTLGWQWTGWKENAALVARVGQGMLQLPGKGASPKDGRLLMTTATDTCYAVQVDVAADKKSSVAGLLLFYDEKAFAGVALDLTSFYIYKNANEVESVANTFGRRVKLRLENKNGLLTVHASKDGRVWTTLASDINVTGFHHNNLGDFLALRPTLYASGKGVAQFRNFQYFIP